MKLATRKSARPDGELMVVSTDLRQFVPAKQIADSMQDALDRWAEVQEPLRSLSRALDDHMCSHARPFDPATAHAPLPRAWQWLDGSAFDSHGDLMSKVFGIAAPRDRRLMYQGLSHQFYSGSDDIPFRSEEDGIDFEGEFGVIVDHVPMGTPPEAASGHIKLIVLINDWSLRVLAPVEMKTGFGWVQAKPACSVAPIAITPEELGPAWRDDRVDLAMEVDWNDRPFGRASGYAMSYSFSQLIAHAAATRALCAGTIVGSGTVSNENYREIGSSCIAEKRGIELLDSGSAKTAYMRFGDTVSMRATLPGGLPAFGTLRQRVIRAP